MFVLGKWLFARWLVIPNIEWPGKWNKQITIMHGEHERFC